MSALISFNYGFYNSRSFILWQSLSRNLFPFTISWSQGRMSVENVSQRLGRFRFGLVCTVTFSCHWLYFCLQGTAFTIRAHRCIVQASLSAWSSNKFNGRLIFTPILCSITGLFVECTCCLWSLGGISFIRSRIRWFSGSRLWTGNLFMIWIDWVRFVITIWHNTWHRRMLLWSILRCQALCRTSSSLLFLWQAQIFFLRKWILFSQFFCDIPGLCTTCGYIFLIFLWWQSLW